MNARLRLVFHPKPELERFETSLVYTDILFGFVIWELFRRLVLRQNLIASQPLDSSYR
jgi:hypothetical protein